jgi:phosphate transport system permease protein
LAFVAGLAFPIGVAAAVYLEEYARPSRLTRLFDIVIRNLAGVPSVVYGILGLVVFKELLGTPRVNANGTLGEPAWWQFTGGPSLISAGLTMAILVLPIVIITSAEALRSVPKGLKEAGYGVGATRSEVIRSHVLPYAAPGILTGTVLALSRAIGEAAPLLMVGAVTGLLNSNEGILETLQGKFTALPMVVYSVLKRPAAEGWPAVAAAAILVLVVVLLLANGAAILLRNRFERKRSS